MVLTTGGGRQQIITKCHKGYKDQGNKEGSKTEKTAGLEDKRVHYFTKKAVNPNLQGET